MKQFEKCRHCVIFVFLVLLSACAPLIGPYSPVAYQNATSLKAHEFVKGIPSNSSSSKQWQILIKPDGDLMGKFFYRWATSNARTLTKTYIDEFKLIISDAYDEIICLEANKKEATKCSVKGAQQ